MKMVNIGYGNLINSEKVLAIISPDSAPTRRMLQEAREEGKLIDATAGRRMRSCIVLEGGKLIISALQTETLAARLNEEEVK